MVQGAVSNPSNTNTSILSHLSILEVFGELAIAIVGFSGVVVALQARRLSGDWLARIKLSVLLGYGIAGVLWAMLPRILLASDMDETSIWRFSSLVFVAMMVCFAAYRIYQARRAANSVDFAGPVFSTAAFTQMAILGINVYLASALLFMIALLMNLGIGIYMFSLLLRVPEDG